MSENTPEIRIGLITSHWAQRSHLPQRYERSTESTNDLAKTEAFEAAGDESLKVYLTDHQTKGRGRGGNRWIDAQEGSALLSSWSFMLQDPPQPTLTAKLGLALVRALSSTWSFLPWSLKSPNDIFLNDRKVAGLLVETLTQGPDVRLIVGLGLNVWDAPENVDATHIARELPQEAPLLGEDWIAFLDRWVFELSDAVGRAEEPLNGTERLAIREFLNRRPSLPAPIDEVQADGSLIIAGKKKPWMEL